MFFIVIMTDQRSLSMAISGLMQYSGVPIICQFTFSFHFDATVYMFVEYYIRTQFGRSVSHVSHMGGRVTQETRPHHAFGNRCISGTGYAIELHFSSKYVEYVGETVTLLIYSSNKQPFSKLLCQNVSYK